MKGSIDAVLAYRPAVAKGLEAYLDQQAAKHTGWQADVIKRLQGFATAGKLLRGSLVCYSYQLCSSQNGQAGPPKAVLDTAVALELIQAALLIHDDIIDQDELRRGQPALHYQYRQLFGRQPAGGEAGNSLALCAGDMTIFMAFGLLAGTQAVANKQRLGQLLAQSLATVAAGQMQDVYLGVRSGCPAKREIYAVMRAKTAAYSLALPLTAGAVLAGQPPRLQRQLQALGLAAGLIFQIRDDELGIFGRPTELGKPVGSHIREGKKTLLYYYLWQGSTGKERQHLGKIFGNPDASPADIASVRSAMRRRNVRRQLRRDIKALKRTAERHISQLGLGRPAQAELQQLVAFCATRQT